MTEVIFSYLLLINVIAFIAFGYDKQLAKNKKHRITELKLLTISAIGGSIGGLLAIYFFKHKNRKLSFMWQFYVVLALQMGLFYVYFIKYS
jgi:uncharacterized membrane protein YsdA (DUF1294 family)